MQMKIQHIILYGMWLKQHLEFIALNTYIKKEKRFKINLRLYLKNLEKDEQIQLKVNIRKVIINMTADINEIENKHLN